MLQPRVFRQKEYPSPCIQVLLSIRMKSHNRKTFIQPNEPVTASKPHLPPIVQFRKRTEGFFHTLKGTVLPTDTVGGHCAERSKLTLAALHIKEKTLEDPSHHFLWQGPPMANRLWNSCKTIDPRFTQPVGLDNIKKKS